MRGRCGGRRIRVERCWVDRIREPVGFGDGGSQRFSESDLCCPVEVKHDDTNSRTEWTPLPALWRPLDRFQIIGVLGPDVYWRRAKAAFADFSVTLRHINGNVSFPPLFHNLISGLIAKGTQFREEQP